MEREEMIETMKQALDAIETAGPYPNSKERATAALAALEAAGLRVVETKVWNDMVEALDQALDDMRGEGQCVCLAVKNQMRDALNAAAPGANND